ncbi:MAG: protein kinase [Gemmatimonadota bacterium]|nr:protein kinase [Gemmatimonadota bacterium]
MPPRVLVVDDDVAIRNTLIGALDDGTIELSVASSAEEAIRTLEADGAPDLVLSDMRMTGLDGFDLLRVIRNRSPDSPVVIMTAYHDVGTAVRAMREGAADFLCKPFDLHELRAVLDRLLKEGRSPDRDRDRHLLAGRYEVEEEVGRGAMARVFRARDARHDRHVAVKVLRKEVAASIGSDRFLREIQIAARLHHPHCLTLIDSGEWDRAPFFVMPLVDGPSLRKRLEAEGPMPATRGAALLRDVASALAAAHELGIVHRDVKPENVLLSGPHAWVADFGVARALDDAAEARATSIGSALGTPEYMAPEQCAGAGDVDHRADIYALGVVAYELLSGSSPFSRDSARAILAAQLTAEPPPLRDRVPTLEPGLEEVVMRCLAKEPANRWSEAAAVAAGFGRYAIERAG